MTKETTYILSEIFKIVFELNEDENPQNIRKINEIRWDSIVTITLVTAIESEFKIKIDVSDVERFSSFQSIQLLINEKTKNT